MPFSKELFIIDAHGFLHRNYHALPKLTTSSGEEAGALYGFINWLIKFLKDKKPNYVAVCFDSKGPTFRHELYANYKANRKPTDAELVSQLKSARDLVSAMGLKTVALAGAEADDLMATLAKLAKKQGKQAVIITSDKDIFQAVGENVKIWSGTPKDAYKGDDACREKFGVNCAYMKDYLSIVGDSADNIPGATGIGAKTAVELINTFGHLSDIYKAVEENSPALKPAVAKKLLLSKQKVLLSEQLVVLKEDLPLGLTLEDLTVKEPFLQELDIFVRRFEFKNLIAFMESFKKHKQEQPAVPQQGELFDLFGMPQQFDDEPPHQEQKEQFIPLEEVLSLAEQNKNLFVYCEEDALVLSSCKDKTAFAEALALTHEQEEKLFAIFDNNNILKIGFDLKYTFRVLGYEPQSGKFIKSFDGALAKYCLDPSGEFSLLGAISVNLGAMLSVGAGLKERMSFYAQNIWALKENLEEKLKQTNSYEVFNLMEMPVMSVLLNMENNGIMVNTAWLKTLSILLEKD